MQAILFHIQRFSLYDGPGIRTTLFFKGCPLACRWCHNPESISPRPQRLSHPSRCVGCGRCRQVCPAPPCTGCMACAGACPTGALEVAGRAYSLQEAADAALEDRLFYQDGGGVTLSGGEPLMQGGFAAALAARLSHEGISVAVDTSGCVPWPSLEAMLPHTALFLYDLKALDEGLHRRLTGVSNRLILRNLDRLCRAGACIRIRIPVIPGLNDSELEALARYIAPLPVEGVELMAYHDTARGKYEALGLPYPLEDTPLPTQQQMGHWISRMKGHGISAQCAAWKGEA